MLLETVLYAAILGLAVGKLTGLFVSPVMNVPAKTTALVVNLGSGVYEEFAFRFLFLSGAISAGSHFLKNNAISYGIAAVLSAVFFSLYHYLGYFNESFEVESFLFRFFAGMVFSAIFIIRGYGIVAYTHSFYNIFLMFR